MSNLSRFIHAKVPEGQWDEEAAIKYPDLPPESSPGPEEVRRLVADLIKKVEHMFQTITMLRYRMNARLSLEIAEGEADETILIPDVDPHPLHDSPLTDEELGHLLDLANTVRNPMFEMKNALLNHALKKVVREVERNRLAYIHTRKEQHRHYYRLVSAQLEVDSPGWSVPNANPNGRLCMELTDELRSQLKPIPVTTEELEAMLNTRIQPPYMNNPRAEEWSKLPGWNLVSLFEIPAQEAQYGDCRLVIVNVKLQNGVVEELFGIFAAEGVTPISRSQYALGVTHADSPQSLAIRDSNVTKLGSSNNLSWGERISRWWHNRGRSK